MDPVAITITMDRGTLLELIRKEVVEAALAFARTGVGDSPALAAPTPKTMWASVLSVPGLTAEQRAAVFKAVVGACLPPGPASTLRRPAKAAAVKVPAPAS